MTHLTVLTDTLLIQPATGPATQLSGRRSNFVMPSRRDYPGRRKVSSRRVPGRLIFHIDTPEPVADLQAIKGQGAVLDLGSGDADCQVTAYQTGELHMVALSW